MRILKDVIASCNNNDNFRKDGIHLWVKLSEKDLGLYRADENHFSSCLWEKKLQANISPEVVAIANFVRSNLKEEICAAITQFNPYGSFGHLVLSKDGFDFLILYYFNEQPRYLSDEDFTKLKNIVNQYT